MRVCTLMRMSVHVYASGLVAVQTAAAAALEWCGSCSLLLTCVHTSKKAPIKHLLPQGTHTHAHAHTHSNAACTCCTLRCLPRSCGVRPRTTPRRTRTTSRCSTITRWTPGRWACLRTSSSWAWRRLQVCASVCAHLHASPSWHGGRLSRRAPMCLSSHAGVCTRARMDIASSSWAWHLT